MEVKGIEDIEFEDAVISLPKNTVHLSITAKTYEADGEHTIRAEFTLADIRDMFETFEKTIDGDYPVYALTEEGKRYAEELLRREGKC